MSSWMSLLKKEIRLGLPAFLIPVIAFIVVAGIGSYIGYRHGFGIEGFTGIAILATGAQMFYLPCYLFFSLQAERKKLHLWLHNPLPGASLIGAKVVAGLISMLLTILITGVTGLIALSISENVPDLQWDSVINLSFFGGVHLVLFSLSFAACFIFFWMIYLMFTRSIGTFLSFLSTFILFVASTSLFGWFSNSSLYAKLTMWGEVPLTGLAQHLNFFTDVQMGNIDVGSNIEPISVFIGGYVFETILALILFFAACWILDRKVEV
ncbi:hypothetical protein GN156_05990 [bacterium LRH843]|nr:hypothetical protein [bacterium LRH843]